MDVALIRSRTGECGSSSCAVQTKIAPGAMTQRTNLARDSRNCCRRQYLHRLRLLERTGVSLRYLTLSDLSSSDVRHSFRLIGSYRTFGPIEVIFSQLFVKCCDKIISNHLPASWLVWILNLIYFILNTITYIYIH